MNLLKLLLLLLALVKADLPITPPAIIWGVKLPKAPSIFEYVNTKMLLDMLEPFRESHMIIGYFATELTAKDFSCLEPDCFDFLRYVKPFNYYSQVHRPLAALQNISPVIWEEREALLQLTCQKNQIHVYNFTDRNLREHDHLMSVVSNNLITCPLIQIYTAHWEEIWALKRRHDRFYLKGNRHELARETPRIHKNSPTVLRNVFAIVSIDRIVLAEEQKKGLNIFYKRSEIALSPVPLRFEPLDGKNIRNGFNLIMSTTSGSINIEVLPVIGNFRISRIIFNDNITFMPRDLVFYSQKFSFCCRSFTAYSELGGRISFYMLYMDVVLNGHYSALDPDYVPKQCWLCESFMTPGITQSIFTILILLLILSAGTSMLLNIGRQKRYATATEPELHVKS